MDPGRKGTIPIVPAACACILLISAMLTLMKTIPETPEEPEGHSG